MEILGQIARYLDPLSLLIVFGGAALAAAARSTKADISRAISALGQLFSADPEADARAARVAVGRIEQLAEIRSIACADRVNTTGRFLRRAAMHLSDAASVESFARFAREDIDRRTRRHQDAIGVWRAVAEAAPGMGMIGTILGLIQMFAVMDDPSRIGPGMALALLTTLYGIILSSAIAGPVAARLERLSEAELAWQRWTFERLEQLARAELEAHPLRTRLNLRAMQ